MDRLEIKSLNQLQILLMVLVQFGLKSSYDLLSKAGLRSGLTSPALRRLQEAGLLASTPGPRKRVEYALTEKGGRAVRENLEAYPQPFWQQGQTDVFESLPRAIILAWLHSGKNEAHLRISEAEYELSMLTHRRQRDAEEFRTSMLRLQDSIQDQGHSAAKGILIATAYQWIKSESDAILFTLQAEAIGKMGRFIEQLPPAPALPESS
jgi:DNA-binding MarR family transcriptional regulator